MTAQKILDSTISTRTAQRIINEEALAGMEGDTLACSYEQKEKNKLYKYEQDLTSQTYISPIFQGLFFWRLLFCT